MPIQNLLYLTKNAHFIKRILFCTIYIIIYVTFSFVEFYNKLSILPITHLDLFPFGLGASNTHWGYGSASAYSPYLAGSGLSSCTTPTSAQFNNPALGFTCSSNEQASSQDFSGGSNRDCVPSKY